MKGKIQMPLGTPSPARHYSFILFLSAPDTYIYQAISIMFFKAPQTASKTATCSTSQHLASKMFDRNPMAGYSFPVTLRHLILGDQFNEPLEGVVMGVGGGESREARYTLHP